MDDALPRADVERGPWPTGRSVFLALLPLAIAIGAAVAADRSVTIGPAAPNQLQYWVALPLALLFPTVAALARRMAYAPMTVLVTAAIAPAFAYATWLLLQPLPKDALGRSLITPTTVANIALPPAVVAAGAFISIELASAAMRRGVAVGVFGAIAAALVFATAIAAPLLIGPLSFG